MGNTRDTGYLRNLLSLSESGKLTEIKVGDKTFTEEKILDFNLTIAPEVLEIQVDAPQASQDTAWLWTWVTSSLPYARTTITNSPQLSVPLYRKGAYVVNNFAANDLHGSMTQVHKLYLKWIDGAGTANNVSWATSVSSISYSHPDINGGASTNVQRITVNVPENITLPTLVAPQVSYDVSFTTPGSYHFGGSAYGENPNLGPFYRGGTYTFNLDSSLTGHPFYLTTDNGANFATGAYFGEYTNGVTGSRNTSGTLVFTVPQNAPDTLYYQCGVHGSMRGVISVKNLAVETNNNGNYIVYFQHDQEGHRTPIELRPIPSLVNQMCLVYDATVGKFVPQDLATYVENTPSFKNKIQEVAGTATLIAPDGIPVVASVSIVEDASYLPLVGNKLGDIAYSQDTNTLYIWNGSVWESTKPANTNELAEGSTNKYYTDARVGSYLTTNNYATQSYVGVQVANLVSSAPTTLDTLNELAAALGNDPNFATSVTTSIATKVPQTRTISINGTSYDLSADRSWTIAAGLTSFNTRTGDITLSSADVTTALGYTPVTNARTLTINGTAFDLSADRSWTIAAGLTSFNTRTGAITLTSADVTTALGYTPYNSTNPNSYVALGSAITGYTVGANTALAATDTILGAFNKIQGQLNGKQASGSYLTSYSETSTLANVTARGATTNAAITVNGDLTVGAGGASSIYMNDSDEGQRMIHCNSNRIGFLNQGQGWGSYCNDDGSWVSVGDITAFSDARVKENIETITNALSKVTALRGVSYNRIDDTKKVVKIGVIAQETQVVLPEVVQEQNDGMLSVSYGNMAGLFIEAFKEQQVQLMQQKAQIDELMEIVKTLKGL